MLTQYYAGMFAYEMPAIDIWFDPDHYNPDFIDGYDDAWWEDIALSPSTEE